MPVDLDDIRSSLGLFYLAMNPTYEWAYHQQELVVPALERVVVGDLRRLINIQPPRYAKTDLGTRAFIPFYFGHHPTARIMLLAYGHKHARRIGRDIRDLMQKNELYHELFPEAVVTGTSRAADEFQTASGGMFYAGGFDTGINGVGCQVCVAGDQRVLTQRGWLPINKVVEGDVAATLWGWRRVMATQYNGPRTVMRIGFGSHSLIVTPNHDILTDAGMRNASTLRQGDRVYGTDVRMVQGRISSRPRATAVRSQLLLAELQRETVQRGLREEAAVTDEAMRRVWRSVPSAQQDDALLQSGMWGQSTGSPSTDQVPDVPQFVPASNDTHQVLLEKLQEYGACGAHSRGQQPKLQRRGMGNVLLTALQEGYFTKAPYDVSELLGMRYADESRVPSPRREQAERLLAEHSRLVPTVSHEVSQVERCGVAPVYDIEVEGDHSFIAEGLLVGNCVIDDPHKNKDDAQSETVLERIRSIYNNVVRLRLEPNAAIVINSTRWTPNDLIGWRIGEDGAVDYFTNESYVNGVAA